MKPLREVGISVPVESVHPVGDLVLVKPEPESEKVGHIFLPETARDKERGTRRGTVVACGPGDRAPLFECRDCGLPYASTMERIGEGETFKVASCPYCGCSDRYLHARELAEARAMHVKPGDTVIFPRVPANRVVIDGEEMVFLHEQQHVLAVIE